MTTDTSEQDASDRPTFTQFGRHFQEQVMQALLTDPRWAEQMVEVFDASFFDLKYIQFLSERYFLYAKKYRQFPSLKLLVTIIKDDLKGNSDASLRGQIVDYLTRIRSDPDLGDLPYVKEKSLEFCRKQALRVALEEAVDDIAAERYDQIVARLKEAVAVGTPTSPGLDLADDVEARYVVTARNPVPTGKPQLDAKGLLNGGLGNGELGVVVAPTGVGKCSAMNTPIKVRYNSITVDGKKYKPWDIIATKRGRIRAHELTSSDELI